MKKTLQFTLIIGCILCSFQGFSQDSFEDKKHSHKQSYSSVKIGKFQYPKVAKKTGRNLKHGGYRNFSIQRGFNPQERTTKYQHRVFLKSKDGRPTFIKSVAKKETTRLSNKNSLETTYLDYLQEIAPLLKIENVREEFRIKSKNTGALGQTHIKLQQIYLGLPIYGKEVIVHVTKENVVSGFNGYSLSSPNFTDVTPYLSGSEALKKAQKDSGITDRHMPQDKKTILNLPESQKELLIYPYENKNYLAWHLTVFSSMMDRWEYFVDAKSGSIIDKYYHSCTFSPRIKTTTSAVTSPPPETGSGQDLNGINRQVNSFNINGTRYLIDTTKPMYDAARSDLPDNGVGVIMTLDLRNEPAEEGVSIFHITSNSGNWNQANAVSAHHNANIAYDYFRDTFNRNSINGQGGTIISIVNVADENGNGFDNAFWNGKAMFYGNGNVAFTSLAGALDVGGHEMSHGVIQNTANLEYRDQQGAINESFADIFGAMIDRDDWLLGEDIVTDNVYRSGALRNMQDPNNGGNSLNDPGWQPKDMSEIYTGNQDNGGVHINSGIVNRAYYLVADVIGKERAEQIYYRALTTYLTVSSQFIDLRIAAIQSATDLHGANSEEVRAIETAYDTVGITDGAPTDTNDDVPAVEGDDFILSYDVNSNDPNTLYISDNQAQNFFPISTTSLFRKPSVADDGSLAIYVTANNTINAITLDTNNPEETVISSDPIWAAVSLSKDGTKLAAVLNDQSNTIFILDLVNDDFRQFQLFNPTSADGVTTGEVLYPDALEWDYTGEYVMYDALNSIRNGNGDDIEYWDVGFLRAWNTQANTYGDGSIQKLFSDLPDGVSIGNPSFSKTSNNIVAFDLLDATDNTYQVLTANIETNDLQVVWNNNKLGFPNYSKLDDQLIFDTTNNSREVIAIIDIAADKVTPSGNASEFILDGQWGIWYTKGTRGDGGNGTPDADNDGVVDALDQCPNTAPGTVVDVTGCPIFSLPANNFAVLSKGESCRSSGNGSIQINALTNLNYTLRLTGPNGQLTETFTTSILVSSLEGGTYSACITVQGQVGYEQCFDIVVDEPTLLGVSSKIDKDRSEVTLELSGGDRYIIQLNDRFYSTSEAEITLPLSKNNNVLSVKTTKDCQGIYEETFALNDAVLIYPNPIQGGDITVVLPKEMGSPLFMELRTTAGALVVNKKALAEEIFKINVDEIPSGIYLLTIGTESTIKSYKIIKK